MVFPQDLNATQCCRVCANASYGLPNYLLLPAPLLPVLLLLLLDLPDDFEEKSLVMNSETSGSSWLEFSIFIDCSISCRKRKHNGIKDTGIPGVTEQLTLPWRKKERRGVEQVKGTGSKQWCTVIPKSTSETMFCASFIPLLETWCIKIHASVYLPSPQMPAPASLRHLGPGRLPSGYWQGPRTQEASLWPWLHLEWRPV